jgi:DNA-binding beta-propeller fold protein YncE
MLLFLVFFVSVLLGGCQPGGPTSGVWPMADTFRDNDNSSRLSCFLTLKESEGPAIRLEIANIEILADGLWLPLASGPVALDSATIGAGQVFLGGRAIPPGVYHRLRLTVTKGAVRQADGLYEAVLSEPLRMYFTLSDPLQLDLEDSRSLFFTWDVLNSLEAGNTLRPALTVASPVRQLMIELVFTACPDIDTVYVIRADRNWVVDSFGLKGGPTYLALDPDPSRQRMYILASREATVKVVDLSSHRVIDFFPVPLNDAPTFMTISSDGRWAYLLDERSSYLSRMDLFSGSIVARVRLGNRPNFVALLAEQNLLAVSIGLSQAVLLLDPVTLAVVGTIATGSSPQGLLAADNQLYIAEGGDHTVSVVDLGSRRNLSRLTVGFGPRRLLKTDSMIYVSNYDQGSLSVLMPGQLGVIQEIPGVGRPLEMVLDQFYRRIYVGDEETAALAVIDINSNLLIGRIALGARPLGLAVIQ